MRRDNRFEFRLSELEVAKLTFLAEKKGVSNADIVRLLIANEYDVVTLRKGAGDHESGCDCISCLPHTY